MLQWLRVRRGDSLDCSRKRSLQGQNFNSYFCWVLVVLKFLLTVLRASFFSCLNLLYCLTLHFLFEWLLVTTYPIGVQIILRYYDTPITITASIWRSIESVNSRLINHLKGFRELPMQDRIRFHSQKCGV